MHDAYLAEFDTPAGPLWVTARQWSLEGQMFMPSGYWDVLKYATTVDVALRVCDSSRRAVLILTSNDKTTLRGLPAQLESARQGTEVLQATDAKSFDAIVSLENRGFHILADQAGFGRNGHALGADFRLYSEWTGQAPEDDIDYQLCLRNHPTNADQERKVKKYLAWLDLEKPFSDAVRELQRILARRLLRPTWLSDEYLLFDSEQVRAQWADRINTHFLETTGKIGFPEAPLDIGDFSDLLELGYHSARDGTDYMSVPTEGAATFDDDEISWLIRQTLVDVQSADAGVTPEIFISYASADFTHADAVRQRLEANNHRCWIAPRDINAGGLPYTEAIPAAIKSARVLVVLVSEAANVSVHVPRELDLAVSNKLQIIPIRVTDIEPAGQLEYLLRTCQWLDLFNAGLDSAIRELEGRIRTIRGAS